MKIHLRLWLLILMLGFSVTLSFSQAAGDYRSATSGDWNALTTWERYNGTVWETPTILGWPGELAGTGAITIQASHIVSVASDLTTVALGTVTVNGTLQYTGDYVFTLNTLKLTIAPLPASFVFTANSELHLPAQSTIEVTTGGLTVPSSGVAKIFIGADIYSCGGGGECGTFDDLMANGGNPSIILTSPVGTTAQTTCINTAITTITYSLVNGATGTAIAWTPSDPPGINYDQGTSTISGIPTSQGTFTYTITTIAPINCGNGSATGSILVNPTPTLANATQASAVCEGSAATINLTGLTAGSTSTVSYSINGIDQTPVPGIVADALGNGSFATANLTAANNGQTLLITDISTNGSPICTNTINLPVPLNVNPAISGGTINSNQTICSGTSPADLVLAGNMEPVIRWESSTDQAFTIPIPITETATTLLGTSIGNLSADTWLRAVIQSSTCGIVYSAPALISVIPTLTSVFQASTICAGSAATINLTGLHPNSTSTILYSINSLAQIPVTGVIADASGNGSFATANLTEANNGQTLLITDISTNGSPICTNTINLPVLLIVNPAVSGGTATSDQTICSGAFPTDLTLSGHTGSVIRWESSNDPVFTTPNIISETTTTLLGTSIGNLSADTWFRAVIQSSTCGIVYSTPVHITVYPAQTLAGATQTSSICTGSAATINLTGLLPNSTSIISYSINSDSQTAVPGVVADAAGSASFTTVSLTEANNGQTLLITGITNTGTTPNCTKSFNQAVTLSVDPNTVAGNITPVPSICYNTSPADLTLTGNTGVVLKWQKSGDIGFTTPTDISASSITLSGSAIGNLSADTWFRADVQSGICAVKYSAPVLITVNPEPTLAGATQASSVCTGSAATINLTGLLPNSTSKISYSINSAPQTDIPGVVANATGAASFTTAGLTDADNGQTLLITGITTTSVIPDCINTFNLQVILQVDPATVGGIVNSNQTICSGTSPTDLTLSGHTGAVIRWESSNDPVFTTPNIITETTTTLSGTTIGNLSADTWFRTVLQSGTCGIAYSTPVHITVNPVPTLTGASQAATVCAGSTATINLTGLLSGSTSTIIYSINSLAQTPVTGVIADASGKGSFTTANLTDADNGQTLLIISITNTGTTPNCTNSFNQAATLSVDPNTVAGNITPVPAICYNTSPADLTLTGNTGVVLKWQRSGDIGFTTPTDISASSTTLSGSAIGNLSADTWFRVVVQSGICAFEYSASVLIAVNPEPTLAGVTQASSVCTGSTVTINLAGLLPNSISTISYSINSISQTDISGVVADATGAASFTTASLTDADNGHTLLITAITNTSATPNCPRAFAKDVNLSVNPNLPVSVTVAASANPVCSGTIVNFTAIPVNPGTNPSYAWKVNGSDMANNSPNYSYTPVNGDNITCDLISNETCTSGSPATSDPVTMAVNPISTVTVPANMTVCNGETLADIEFSGTATFYNWTNSEPSVGILANGSGKIPSFVASNTGNSALVATITVTPVYSNAGIDCPGTPQSFSITVSSVLSATVTPTNITCNGANDGTITISAPTGGSGSYEYSIDGTNWTSSSVFKSLAPAFYQVQMRDNVHTACAVNLADIPFDEPALLSATVKPYNATCSAPNSGKITVSDPSGGWGSYEFSIDGGTNWQTSGDFTGLANSTYVVQMRDANAHACVRTLDGALTLNDPNSVSIVKITSNSPVCQGSDLNLSVDVSGGSDPITFAWTGPDSFVSIAQSPNILSVLPLASGDYSVTATDNTGCSATASVLVTIIPGAVLNTLLTASVCSGTLFSYAPNSGTPGAIFTWSRAAVAGIENLASTGTAAIAETLVNATSDPLQVEYEFTISTANGCQSAAGTNKLTVTVYPAPSLTSWLNPAGVCSSILFDYTATFTIPGTTLTWNRAVVPGISNPTGSGTTADIHEILINTTPDPVVVPYICTLTKDGCTVPVTVNATIKPTPTISNTPVPICSDASFSYTPASLTTGTKFNWFRTPNPSISNGPGLGNGDGLGKVNEILTNITNSPATAIYTYTLQADGCSNSQDVPVTVNPTPIIDDLSDQHYCNGETALTIPVTGSVSGTIYSWTNNNPAIGLAAIGSGDIPTFTATNSTNASINALITVTPSVNGCGGISKTFQITVDPSPVLTNPGNQMVCNGGSTTAINFTGTFANITWTNNHPEIGLPSPGTGNIGAFTGKNLGVNPIVATITAIPHSAASGSGCDGTPVIFTITVYPAPIVGLISDQTICAGSSQTGFAFTTLATGGSPTFNWTSDQNIGFGTSGSGSIPTFISTNPGLTPLTANIKVTATINGCTGNSMSFAVTVNPSPTVDQPSDQVVCNNEPTVAITFTGNATSYNWTNDNPLIGLVVNGSGTIASFAANNTGSTPVVGNITVTPTYTGGGLTCQGLPKSFKITVNPDLTAMITGNSAICQNAVQPPVTFTGANGTSPYTFTYKINSGSEQTVITTVGNNSVTLSAPTAVTGTFVYQLTKVASANGCSKSLSTTATINVGAVPTATISGTTTICQNATNPLITFKGANGTAPYTFTYQINGGANLTATTVAGNNSATVSAPTNVSGNFVYTLINVSSSGSCTQAQPGNATITVTPSPTASISGATTICQNTTEPLITFTGTNGTAPYTFTYKINGGTDKVVSSIAGNNSVTISVPTLSAGTFTYKLVNVMEVGGCSQSQTGTVDVVVIPAPILSSSLTPTGICSNTIFNYPQTFSPLGTTFEWKRNVTPGISNTANSSTVDTPDETLFNTTTNPIEVSYNYTLSANGCANSQTVKVMVTATPSLTSSLTPSTICGGSQFSYTPTSNIAGTIFSWTRPAVGGNPAASGTGNPNETLINNTSNPISAIYNYTLSSSSCSNPLVYQVLVTVIPAPVVTVGASALTVCPGTTVNLTSSAVTTTPTSTTLLTENFNGATNSWTTNPASGNGAWKLKPNLTSINSETFSSNDASQFYISDMQSANTTSTLTSPPFSTVGYTSAKLSFWHYYYDKDNKDIASVQYYNGTSWTALSSFTNSKGTSIGFVNEIITLPLGVPNMKIQFNYQAKSDFYWAIDNVTVTGTPTATPTINWTANTSGWTSTIANPTGVTPTGTTTYTATYTDPNTYCPGSNSVTVTVRPTLNPILTADYCSLRPKVQLTVSGSYSSYLWSNGATTPTVLVDIAGNYTATVTDAVGCSGSSTLQVAQELVADGSFTNFNAASPVFFTEYTQQQSYYNGNGSSGLYPEGYYAVNTSAWSNYPSAPQGYHMAFHGRDHTNNLSGARNFLMVNGSAVKIGTPARLRVIWQQTVTVAANTDYYFSAWGMNLNPSSPARLQFEVNGVPVGSIADLNAAGVEKPASEAQVGLSNWVRFYSTPMWNSGATTTAVIRIINLNEDSGGNDFGIDDISFSSLASVPFSAAISSNSPASAPICSRGTLQLTSTITGGKPLINYSWTGPNGFSSTDPNPVLTNVSPYADGEYTLMAKDWYNCPAIVAKTTVKLNPTPEIPDQSTLICSGSSFNATPQDGIPNAATYIKAGTTYSWSAPVLSPAGSISGASAGSALNTISQTLTNTTTSPAIATYTVTPVNGICTGNTFKVVVTVNPTATVNAGTNQDICAGSTVQLNGTKGGAATSANWSGGTGTFNPDRNTLNAVYTPTAAEITAGTVTLTLNSIDPDGAGPCSAATSSVTITINSLPTLGYTAVNVDCHGASTGSVDLTVSSGTPAYGYTWTPSNGGIVTAGQVNSQDLTNLVAGTYTILVKDAKTCTATQVVTLTEPALLAAHESHANVSCTGDLSTVTISAVGGTTPYSGTGSFSQAVGTKTYTVTDAKGCSANVVVTVTANPNTAPAITTSPVARSFNGCNTSAISGPVFSTALTNSTYSEFSDTNNKGVATDNCAITTVSYQDVANSGCPIIVTRTWTLGDASGLTTICQQILTVTDADKPTWSTAAGSLNLTVDCSDATGKASALALFPTATDLCDLTVSNIGKPVKTTGAFVPASGCSQSGTYTNSWVVTDACGNTSDPYIQVITITDNTPPAWTTPAGSLDRTLECSDMAGLNAAKALKPVASDNCDGSVTNIVKVSGNFVSAGSCGHQGTYTNTWTVKDDCGNLSPVFTQVITFTDKTPPVWMTVPGILNTTIECNNASGLVVAQAAHPVAWDNCDSDVTNLVKNAGVFIPASAGSTEGTYTNTWTVKDDCGNVSLVYKQVITTQDNTPPVSYCPPNKAYSCTTTSFDPSVTGMATATDNCDAAPVITYSDNKITTGCAGNYQIVRTWTSTDAHGNASSSKQTIYVQDVVEPTVSCPIDRTIDFHNSSDPSSMGTATASDNCDPNPSVSYTDHIVPGANINDYTIVRTWKATDCANNISTCDQKIIVKDFTLLSITCRPPVTVNTDLNQRWTSNVNPGIPTFTGSGMTYSWSMSGVTTGSGTGAMGNRRFNAGITTITWKARNYSGTATCTQTVTVLDKQSPTFTVTAIPLTACVESLKTAIYNSATTDINPDRPDYFTFDKGLTSLNLNTSGFSDNCSLSTCTVEIRWRIDLSDGTSIPALPTDYMTGQPSAYANDINFPGDGINYTTLTHTITYWIVDCSGNVSLPKTRKIIIKPRPKMTKGNN